MAVCLIAVWRGGDEERLAAGGLLANWALSMVVYKSHSQDTQWAVFAFDASLLALYVWLAMRTRRFWPLFAAGFQVLVVVIHLGRAADAGVSGWAYITGQLILAYLVLFTIGYGAWTAPYYAESTDEPDDSPADAPGATRR
jgi:hypothetical protein